MSRKIKTLIVLVYSLLLVSCRSQGWVLISPETSPPPSGQGAVAFMDSTNTAVLFGGITSERWINETWTWDGKTWLQVFPTNPPPAREKLAMAYDASRDKVVLFGGVMDKTLFNDTWEWDGENWQLMNPAHIPPARCCLGMAYDTANKNIVMYGGYDPNENIFLGDTWVWDGTDWTEITCCDPPQMSGHAMVGFPANNEVISIQTAGFGTWAWNGEIWRKLGIESPPHRSEGRTAYDSFNNWAIFFGGIAKSQFLDDTWIFDGKKWFPVSLSNNPLPRYGHVLFYDANRESMLIFGGIGNDNTFLGDTWELKLPGDLTKLIAVATPSVIP